MADCRKCKYFIPADRLPAQAKVWCTEWVGKYRTNDPLLGYCKARKRPVTYYEGKCRYYSPRTRRQRSLDEVVG